MHAPPEGASAPGAGFSGLMLDALRQTKNRELSRAEASLIERLLQLSIPAHVLDVPCGNGRIALELAARGFRITGVDTARPFLEEAQRAADERRLSSAVTFVERDMRDLPWRAAFDGAFCFWESFGYFDEAGNRAFLEAVASALKPRARFVLDTHVVETLLSRAHQRNWSRFEDGLLALEEFEYDHVSGTVTRRWIFSRGRHTEERALTFRLYAYRELAALVEAAGFSVVEAYDYLTLEPFRLGASRLVLVVARV